MSRTLRQAVVVIVIAVGATMAAVFAADLKNVDFNDLSRDPSQVLDGEYFIGWFANFVVLVWQIPATVGILAAVVLRKVGRRAQSNLLLAGGILTALMVLDDFFLLHDAVYPALGVREEVVYLVYIVATAAFAFRFRGLLGWGGLTLVCGTWMFWGLSVGLDFVLHQDAPYVLEDGAKAVGVGLWALLIVRYAVVELGALRPPDQTTTRTGAAAHRRQAAPRLPQRLSAPPRQRSRADEHSPNGRGAPREEPVAPVESPTVPVKRVSPIL